MRRSTVLGLAAVLAATAVAYAPAVAGGFVYDDHYFVVDNDAIKDPRRVVAYLTDPATAAEGKRWGTIHRPLRTVSYAADHAAWRLNPTGYHLTSLLLQLVAACGVFALAARWTGDAHAALVGAALFAWHPLDVPSEQ